MTRRDILNFFHEPFSDAFYFGPEKISPAHLRWPADKIERTGRGNCTYEDVLQSILSAVKDSTKRVFIKDMSYHIIPPTHSSEVRPPSLQASNSSNRISNPTLLPTEVIDSFKFVFLIRNPVAAIPSLYRCFIPPLSAQTGDNMLDPTELGYRELRIFFDYLRDKNGEVPMLIDAEDLLSNPEGVLRHLCTHLEFPYDASMLQWPSNEDRDFAFSLFEKFAGYHEDALNSKGLVAKPKAGVETPSKEKDRELEAKFGKEGIAIIRDALDMCQKDYEGLEAFRVIV
ncbi:MAG: hypothetical protein Q9215_004766 [Flavoplaca cf. flavocitrina]